MGNDTAYKPLKESEGDEEAVTSGTPRWAKTFGGGDPQRRLQTYLPVLRIAFEVILVLAVFLLSLKVFMDRNEGRCRLPMVPNDPLKNCQSRHVMVPQSPIKSQSATWTPSS